jgi:hypothetical protein
MFLMLSESSCERYGFELGRMDVHVGCGMGVFEGTGPHEAVNNKYPPNQSLYIKLFDNGLLYTMALHPPFWHPYSCPADVYVKPTKVL